VCRISCKMTLALYFLLRKNCKLNLDLSVSSFIFMPQYSQNIASASFFETQYLHEKVVVSSYEAFSSKLPKIEVLLLRSSTVGNKSVSCLNCSGVGENLETQSTLKITNFANDGNAFVSKIDIILCGYIER
jgi:hypothetical protein